MSICVTSKDMKEPFERRKKPRSKNLNNLTVWYFVREWGKNHCKITAISPLLSQNEIKNFLILLGEENLTYNTPSNYSGFYYIPRADVGNRSTIAATIRNVRVVPAPHGRTATRTHQSMRRKLCKLLSHPCLFSSVSFLFFPLVFFSLSTSLLPQVFLSFNPTLSIIIFISAWYKHCIST